MSRVTFELWCKIELDEEGTALINRYGLDRGVLISGDKTALLKLAGTAGFLAMRTLLTLKPFIPALKKN